MDAHLTPADVAATLRKSLETDHKALTYDPWNQKHLLQLAPSIRALGIEAEARRDLEIPANDPPLKDDEIADWIRTQVSPHPARFAEIVEAHQALEAFWLKQEAERLEGCGQPWGRIVRLFWRDRRGRERMRMLGLHSCKSRHCPRCGRSTQMQRTTLMEKILILATEWGLDEHNVRFGTLTIENGTDIASLREEAHTAWGKLERGRWWPRNVFGWFRSSECVTGKDGQWNFHMHIVAILWSPWISYAHLWDAWGKVLGRRARVDMETLRHYRKTARGQGLVKAARYATKYLSKQGDLGKVTAGPGGFAHYVKSLRRLRTFAVGGGASVLRRMTHVLMPDWALRAERTLQDEFLNPEGRPPWRVEEVNPETGEVFEREPHVSPFADTRERETWFAAARELYTVKGLVGTVGEPCGLGNRLRRIGATPLPSRAPTVGSFEQPADAGSPPLTGFRALVAGGTWKVYRWTDTMTDKRTGKPRSLHRACVLPVERYSWKAILAILWKEILREQGPLADRRRAAYRAWADATMRPPESEPRGMIDPGTYTRIRWVGGKPIEDRIVIRTPARSPSRCTFDPEVKPRIVLDALRTIVHGCNDAINVGERRTTRRQEQAWKLQKEVWTLARSGEDPERRKRLEGHIVTLSRPHPVFARSSKDPDQD